MTERSDPRNQTKEHRPRSSTSTRKNSETIPLRIPNQADENDDFHLPGWHPDAPSLTDYRTRASGCQPGRCSGSRLWPASVAGSDGPVVLIVVVPDLVMVLVGVIVLMVEVVVALQLSTGLPPCAPPPALVELARHRAAKTVVGVTGHTDRHGRHDGRHAESPRDSSTRPWRWGW